MKTLTISLAICIMAFMAGSAMAQITGSGHDFSSAGWNTSGEICIACHTPHNALAVTPLWNHEVSTATFTLYTSTTMNATTATPSGTSLLCLSCHDGSVALDNFGGVTIGTNIIAAPDLLGTDLSNDHPVSFVYNATLATADGELHDPSTATGITGTIEADMLFGTTGNATMECASCHDVHNGGPASVASLLVKSNAASALCLTCHDK